jgi:hypothetical protein
MRLRLACSLQVSATLNLTDVALESRTTTFYIGVSPTPQNALNRNAYAREA